ncbi:hypothetical protein BDN67DRAFT_975209, partial [Paxillus ammoniavirescens]
MDCSATRYSGSELCARIRRAFTFNQTFIEYLDKKTARCNHADCVSTYVTYPPKGLLPLGDVVTGMAESGKGSPGGIS